MTGYVAAITTTALTTQSAAAPLSGAEKAVHPVRTVIPAPSGSVLQPPPKTIGRPIT